MSIRCCVIPLLPEDKVQDAISRAVKENPRNALHIKPGQDMQTLPGHVGPKGKPIRIGIDVTRMWKPGKTLRVRFLGGSDFVRSKVKQYAVVWSKYANIHFQFIDDGYAEIRVGFEREGSSWCALGTDCLNPYYGPNDRTMNFGLFTDDTGDDDFSNTTIHEFGHALGCIHEHQQPNAHILWNKPVVYRYYAENNGWSKEDVDFQVFQACDPKTVSATPLDRLSIMEYWIPAEFTLDGWSAPYNINLSDQDKVFIRQKYPPALSNDKFHMGTVNTMAVRDLQAHAADNRMTIAFNRPFQQPPPVLLGLNHLDFDKDKNIRIRSTVEDVRTDRMTVNLMSWGDSVQYASGCSWLVASLHDTDFQFGHFSTEDDHPSTKPQPTTHQHISFPQKYQDVPRVIVWLDGLDVACAHDCRVKAYVSDVTTSGFDVHVDTWADTTLFSASVVWAAHSAGRPDLCSGTFSTEDARARDPPRCDNAGSVAFDTAFEGAPQVFAGLNMLDLGNGGGQRVKLDVDSVGPTSMEWHLDAWGDAVLYAAGAAYLAVTS